jgi:CheY-like chemotaxis protein
MENETSLNDSQTQNKKTVLVVDDSEVMCFLVKSILENNYEIVIKYDGQDALDYLHQGNRPDLILLDMLMPKMNGRTFARRIHADPRYGNIPIIFITTVDSTMLINSFKAMGVIDFVIKPFINDDLLIRVNKILNPQ